MKHDKIQITDTTIFEAPSNVGYLLQNWVIHCDDKKNNGKTKNFIKSTKTNSPKGNSGAANIHPTGDNFMYIETSSGNNGNIVLVSFERTDIIQKSNKTFYYNRFSSSDPNLRAKGGF